MGVNNLPKTVTRQRRDCDLNPGPSAPESSTLTTRLPSYASECCCVEENSVEDDGDTTDYNELPLTYVASPELQQRLSHAATDHDMQIIDHVDQSQPPDDRHVTAGAAGRRRRHHQHGLVTSLQASFERTHAPTRERTHALTDGQRENIVHTARFGWSRV